MNLTSNIILNIYSILLLLILCVHSIKHTEKDSLPHKLFMMMLYVTLFMLVVDIFSRCDGKPGTIYPFLNDWGNFLVYLSNLMLPSLWLLYTHYQVFQKEEKTKRWMYPLIALNVVNIVLVVLSQFYNWFYYIDSNNIYHRGPLFLLPVCITLALIFTAVVIILTNYNRIEKKYYFSLLFFAIPPMISILLQFVFYGISLIINSVVISLLIVFLNIQNHSIYTDHLTGINNRKKLEAYLNDKIATCTESVTFSAILIDMDNFKTINDTFGHDVGDDALETAVTLLKNCLRSNDFISRYGGDEFYIILDLSDQNDLEAMVSRIERCIEKFNESSSKPYKLRMSMGYAVYDYHSHLIITEFQKKIDLLMYENKRINKLKQAE